MDHNFLKDITAMADQYKATLNLAWDVRALLFKNLWGMSYSLIFRPTPDFHEQSKWEGGLKKIKFWRGWFEKLREDILT